MAYSFRLHFRLPQMFAIGIDLSKWVISPEGVTPEISLRSPNPDVPIKGSKDLILRGEGYATDEAARAAGELTRNSLTLAFAKQRIAADFGDRAPHSGFFPAGLRMLEQQTGHRVLNDTHGLMTFESDPAPMFSAPSASAVIVKNFEHLAKSVSASLSYGNTVTERIRLAFDLFSASAFQPSPDSRFLLLMMAIETILDPAPRPEPSIRHVRMMIDLTEKSSELAPEEKASMCSSLRSLMDESIGQAGRRLVSTLGDRDYQGLSPKKLFTESYELRSNLVHGNAPRPTTSEVGNMAAKLDLLVGDLLCGPLLNEVE